MDNKTNKYIAVSYKLYVDGDNGKELIEEATAERPFSFLTGFGFALDKFEEQMIATEKGQDFKLTLSKEEGYGEYHEEYTSTSIRMPSYPCRTSRASVSMVACWRLAKRR